MDEYHDQILIAREKNNEVPEFPEHLIIPKLDNTWHDTAEAVINNWIGKVYQLTNCDRRIPFMAHIDPNNPLNL